MWADGHHRGQNLLGFPVIRHKQHVAEGENVLSMVSSDLVIFLASGTKFGTLAHLDMDITTLYKNGLGCILHVLGTCTEFEPLFYFFRLQGKSLDGYDSNFVTRWLP